MVLGNNDLRLACRVDGIGCVPEPYRSAILERAAMVLGPQAGQGGKYRAADDWRPAQLHILHTCIRHCVLSAQACKDASIRVVKYIMGDA